MVPIQEILSQNTSQQTSATITPIEVPSSISLAEFIFYRITQANPKLKTIFGIPGDFNLNFIDHVYSPVVANRGVKLINVCNELNGAYAADAYARVIDGLSVLITTYGVGELSAINGIAGAFAEYSPVLHIVGMTSLKQQEEGKSQVKNLHHLLPNHDCFKTPDHLVYEKMIDAISCAKETLTSDMDENSEKIDKVLKKIIQERRPGYLFIPCDIPDLQISSQSLFANPFSSASKYENTEIFSKLLDTISDEILVKFYESKNPSVLSDCLTTRFGAQKQLDNLIEKLPESVKIFTSNFGRNVDETKSNYAGVYNGGGSATPRVQQLLESSDFLLLLGYYNTEMNNGTFSTDFSRIKDVVILHPDYVQVNGKTYNIKQSDGERLFQIGSLLEVLAEKFDANKLVATKPFEEHYEASNQYRASELDSQFVPQDKLTDHFNQTFQPGDLFIVDTMSFVFGLPDVKFTKGVKLLSSTAWGSIGWALPASFGATFASNDLHMNGRIILVQGDGGAQMTVQELSSFIRYHDILPNKPQIYMINNYGYTIERAIKGPNRPYNDINANWKWCDLLSTFGGEEGITHESIKLNNVEEFDAFFAKRAASHQDMSKLKFYEVICGKYDVPSKVSKLIKK
ncbi:ARO10 [Candida oxycetoniae]|uniref:ARO10 n=1 Tax=Candida oxycetoniae TaxID=497107 RepID=A0AAI9T097_9ASCO|nr:ARO10 [Candida oxycetoniae]KAI3406065.2 ARO10 [Candida oxycetoniae]